jgi:cytoskeletal protein RodZ
LPRSIAQRRSAQSPKFRSVLRAELHLICLLLLLLLLLLLAVLLLLLPLQRAKQEYGDEVALTASIGSISLHSPVSSAPGSPSSAAPAPAPTPTPSSSTAIAASTAAAAAAATAAAAAVEAVATAPDADLDALMAETIAVLQEKTRQLAALSLQQAELYEQSQAALGDPRMWAPPQASPRLLLSKAAAAAPPLVRRRPSDTSSR